MPPITGNFTGAMISKQGLILGFFSTVFDKSYKKILERMSVATHGGGPIRKALSDES